MPDSPPPRRRPGAPPGNTNALKHGFYAKKLPAADLAYLEGHAFNGLSEEIQATRVIIRRIIEINNNCTDPDRSIAQARVFSHAATTLTRLLRTERILSDSLDPSIHVALREITEELGVH